MSAWIWWLIATFGVAGVVIFIVAAPTTAAIVGKVIAAILSRLLQTRLGCALLAAIVVLIATWIWRDGVLEAEFAQRYADDKKLGEIAAKARDDQIAEDLTKKYQPKVQSLEQLTKSLQKQVADYAKRKPVVVAGKAVAPGSCRLGADALRMRQQVR